MKTRLLLAVSGLFADLAGLVCFIAWALGDFKDDTLLIAGFGFSIQGEITGFRCAWERSRDEAA